MHEGKQVRDRPYFKTVRFRIRPDASVSLLALKAGDIDEMQLTPEIRLPRYFYETKTLGESPSSVLGTYAYTEHRSTRKLVLKSGKLRLVALTVSS